MSTTLIPATHNSHSTGLVELLQQQDSEVARILAAGAGCDSINNDAICEMENIGVRTLA